MRVEQLLVVIPHSGVMVPNEIALENLSEEFPQLLQNVDWYTHWLYDFRDILGNRQVVFPYCCLILEGNRRPDLLEDSVPLKDVYGKPVYRPGREPDPALRKRLAEKYLDPFHHRIEKTISEGAAFLLDGHSTVPARGVEENQIDLMNFQDSPLDEGPKVYSPQIYIETYARELARRLPDVKVTINTSEYYTVYGHVCAAHSINAMGRVGRRVPSILQETCDRLYRKRDGTLNVQAINRLRRAFAESLEEALRLVWGNG
jgi:N-formylglutamate amidohydrolase